jgi:hypothetical protein
MTVQDLISLLQDFPPDLPVRFSAEMGCIETSTPRIEVEEADVDENWQQTVLLIDLDG